MLLLTLLSRLGGKKGKKTEGEESEFLPLPVVVEEEPLPVRKRKPDRTAENIMRFFTKGAGASFDLNNKKKG